MQPDRNDSDPFRSLVMVIVSGDIEAVIGLLDASPRLATERATLGATRQVARQNFIERIQHYLYERDTALHIAAAAKQSRIVQELIARGADVRARNRLGAEPLHYAVDGGPGSPVWDPQAQTTIIGELVRAGADPNARDANGVAPLHRAIRNRCAAAVSSLIERGADLRAANRRGSTPMHLAMLNTGKSGSGSKEAKQQQQEIVRILRTRGAA